MTGRSDDRPGAGLLEIRQEVATLKAELAELRLAQRRWQSVLERSPFGVVVYNPDGSVRTANAAMKALYRLSDEEFEQALSSYNVLADPQLAAGGQLEHVQKAFAGESAILPCQKYRFERPEGALSTTHWVEGVIFPIHEDSGELEEVVAIQVDMTELMKTQEDLRASRKTLTDQVHELDQLYAVEPVGLCLVDTELRILRINDTMAAISGLPADAHLGQRVSDVLPQLADTLEPVYQRVIKAAEPALGLDVRASTPAEPELERDWLVSCYPVVGDDGLARTVTTVMLDISKTKRAERAFEESQRHLHTVIDSADIVLWAVDEEGIFTLSTGRGLHALGLRPDEALGQSLFELYADNREIVESTRRALAGESVATLVEIQGLYFESRFFPLLDSAGRPRGATGVAIDVTERVTFERQRQRLEAEVQQAQKFESLGALAGGIAHDFNNLLMGVLGNADLALLRLPAESPGREYVERISDAAKRASELANQMLAYSGKGQLETGAVDLNRLVEGMTKLMRSAVASRADLSFELAAGVPPIEADASQIRQIVMNLITNASEAIQNGRGVITVRTAVINADEAYLQSCRLGLGLAPGPYVALEVSDSGCGIPRELQKRMFEPFFTTKFAGRGLGLAAVLGIVQSHGAALRVDSDTGRGASITILFPPSSAAVETPAESGYPRPPAEEGRGETILVVDDEELVRIVARAMLESAGYEVVTACDGSSAIQILKDRSPEIDLVLLDMTMPGLDGGEVAERMRELCSDLRLVFSSGYSEQETRSRLGAVELTGFVQKPYRSADLLATVRSALASS